MFDFSQLGDAVHAYAQHRAVHLMSYGLRDIGRAIADRQYTIRYYLRHDVGGFMPLRAVALHVMSAVNVGLQDAAYPLPQIAAGLPALGIACNAAALLSAEAIGRGLAVNGVAIMDRAAAVGVMLRHLGYGMELDAYAVGDMLASWGLGLLGRCQYCYRRPIMCQECHGCSYDCGCPTCTHCHAVVRGVCNICGGCHTSMPGGCRSCIPCQGCGMRTVADGRPCQECNRRFVNHVQIRRPRFHVAAERPERNPSLRYVAAEIEVAGITKLANKVEKVCADWGAAIVGDGSLPGGGFEINTAPAAGDKFVAQVEDICAALDAAGSHVTPSCGLHVHIDARDYDYHALRRLVTLWAHVEQPLFSAMPRGRRVNSYCTPCGPKFLEGLHTARGRSAVKTVLESNVYDGDTGGYADRRKRDKYDGARYRAMNLHSYFYRGTVECRLHTGTVRAFKIVAWGALMAALLDYARSTPLATLRRQIRTVAPAQLLVNIAPPASGRYLVARWCNYAPSLARTIRVGA